jgi:hypothetical protein
MHQEEPMTKIDYPDLVRTSPDGKLRLEIRSPDNDPLAPREPVEMGRKFWGGFQSDFTFTVTRIATGEVLWSRRESNDDLFAPRDAWISNDARAIVINCPPFGADLFVLNGYGETIRRLDVGRELLKNNKGEFRWTSAGTAWYEHGNGVFVFAENSPYWCFRTEYSRQILIDLQRGELVKNSVALLAARKVQREWALALVLSSRDDARVYGEPFVDRDWQFLEHVWTAIFWCGLERVRGALPALRKFEQSTVGRCSTSGWKLSDGSRTRFVHLDLVGVAQFALRRLREEPAGYAPYWLCGGEGQPSFKSRIVLPERLTDRTERLEKLTCGMTQQQIVDWVGMPDHSIRQAWEYDVLHDDNGPYTLRIHWEHRLDGAVAIERQPPGWIRWKHRVGWL